MRSTWAVLMVHGVGDTDTGATMGAFLPRFLGERKTLLETAPPQLRLLVEPEPGFPDADAIRPPAASEETSAGPASRFPAYLRTFSNTTQGEPEQVALAEVFWADLSRAGDSKLEVLRRAIALVFDLRHVADVAAADQGSWLVRVLRLILYAVSWLLCGPIAAVSAFVIVLLFAHHAAVGLHQKVLGIPPSATAGEWGMVAFGLLVTIGMVMLFHWRKRSSPLADGAWSLFAACVAVAGLISIALAAYRLDTPDFPWKTEAGTWLASHMRIHPGSIRDATATQVVVLLGLGYWAFVLLAGAALAAFVLWAAARLQYLAAGATGGTALDAALGASLLQVTLWVIIGTAFGTVVLFRLLPGFENELKEVVLGFTLKLGVVVLIGVCAAAVWAHRWWRVRAFIEGRRAASDIPRLLIHPVVMLALILLTLASVAFFALMFVTGSAFLRDWLGPYAEGAKWLSLGLAAVIGAPFVLEGVRNVLHVLIDITSHFYRPRLNPLETRIKPAKFVTQQRIEARFRRVLQELLGLENVTHLTVIAHSQGTMIALDVLWLRWAHTLLAGKTVYLVTMGSPFSHLYQHYFPHRYPPLFSNGGLSEAWGQHLTVTVRRWINIYRVDDYIGTHVQGGNEFPENRLTRTPGGHTHYWEDPEALEAMAPYLPRRTG